jgi:hypothetical protein
MKRKMSALKWLALIAGACICCALKLPAQNAPSITTQPASQTKLAGSTVTFSPALAGTGPFACQWQLNGTNLPNGIISTVAGSTNYTPTADGGYATFTILTNPSGVALDAFGNMYIADTGDYRVRKVDTNGIITTVAGNGTNGFSGDGGPATQGRLKAPCGVAVDAAGDLYIADTDDQRIRKVPLAGSPALALTNVSATNAGSYVVVITSLYGSMTSAVATLTVQAPLVITLQPSNQTVLAGSSPVFPVAVAGSGPGGYSGL